MVLRRDAERIIAPDFLTPNVSFQGQVLTGLEQKGLAQLLGHVEPDRARVGGLVHHFGHGQLVEGDTHQWHLNRSNGSRQARQRHCALHGVEPKRLSSSVSDEPHCGQVAVRAALGGAMP